MQLKVRSTVAALDGLVAPVTLQLRNGLGECWGARHSAPQIQNATQIEANSD